MLKRFFTYGCLLFVLTNSHFAWAQYEAQLAEIDELIDSDIAAASEKLKHLLPVQATFSSSELAYFHMLDGIVNLYSSNNQKAILAFDNALALQPNDTLLTRLYSYKVTGLLGLKKYEQAFEVLQMNLKRIEHVEDTEMKVSSYIRLMNVLLDLNAFDEMLTTAEQALYFNQGTNVRNECYVQLYQAVATLKLQQTEKAIQRFGQTGRYCAEHNLPLIDIMSQKGAANGYYDLGQYAIAKPLFESALARYAPFNFYVEINDIKAYLADIYFREGNYQQAEDYATELSALEDDKLNNDVKKRAHEVLAKLASHNNDFAKAYQHQVIAHALDLQELDENRHKQNAYQMAKFNVAEKKRENESLLQEHQLIMQQRDLSIKERSSSIMFSTLLFGVSIGLLLLLLTAWFQRNRFMKQAQRDGLTGIFNRQTGFDLAETELVHVQSNGGQYSLMIMDLDFFKSINDRFGHGTGDWTLKKVTHAIEDIIRPTDIFCRLGGEEFVLYMPFTDEKQAVEIAENIREEIEQINTKFSGHNFSITLSIGVASLSKGDLSLDPIMQRADNALYECKRQGRNCVLAYRPEFD